MERGYLLVVMWQIQWSYMKFPRVAYLETARNDEDSAQAELPNCSDVVLRRSIGHGAPVSVPF